MSERVSCLGDEIRDPVILTLQSTIRRFLVKAEQARSVDGLLLALGTLAFELNDFTSMINREQERMKFFESIMKCNEVVEALRPLSRYVDLIQTLVMSDPRHKVLRPYLTSLINHVALLTPPPFELEVTTPPVIGTEEWSTPTESITSTMEPNVNEGRASSGDKKKIIVKLRPRIDEPRHSLGSKKSEPQIPIKQKSGSALKISLALIIILILMFVIWLIHSYIR